MKKRLISTLIVALVAFSFSVVSAQGESYSFQFRGRHASVLFVEQDTCTYSYTSVWLAENVSHNQGKPSRGPEVNVAVGRYNTCTGMEEAYYFGYGAVPFQLNRDSASINVALDVYDAVSGASGVAIVNLSWAAFGGFWNENYVNHDVLPNGARYVSRWNGSTSNADVVGSVILDGIEHAVGAQYGYLGRSTGGSVYIDR